MGTASALLLAAATFVAIVWLKLPLPWLVLGLGGLGMFLAWRKMRSA